MISFRILVILLGGNFFANDKMKESQKSDNNWIDKILDQEIVLRNRPHIPPKFFGIIRENTGGTRQVGNDIRV